MFDECLPEPLPENEREQFYADFRVAWIEKWSIWPPAQKHIDAFSDMISTEIERIQNEKH